MMLKHKKMEYTEQFIGSNNNNEQKTVTKNKKNGFKT